MMRKQTRTSARRAARFAAPRRVRQRKFLGFERLEDRLAPAVGTHIVDVGNVRFVSNQGDFTVDGTTYEIDSGSLSVGYVPIGSENFHALIEFTEVQTATHAIKIDTNVTSPTLAVENDQWLLSIVAITTSQAVPIPVWNSPDSTTTISIPQLTGTGGVSFSPGSTTAFTAAGCDFNLTSLVFANSDNTSTSDSQVWLQGTLDFTKLPLIGNGVQAGVTGSNYVIIDNKSVTLTGLSVKKTFTSKEVAGFEISGDLFFEYSSSSKMFTIAAGASGVAVNSPGTESTIKNANAQLVMTIDTSGQAPNVVNYGLQIGGAFSTKNLSVSTSPGQPLSLQYDYSSDTYSAGGSLNVSIGSQGDKQLSLNLGSTSAPGIVITHGQLVTFSGTLQEDFSIYKVKFQSPGLTFFYQKATTPGTDTTFQMYGSVDMVVADGSNTSIFKVSFGTSQTDSGVTVVDGTLTQLNIGIQAGAKYSVSGLSLTAFGAGVKYDNTNNNHTFIVYGAFGADFKVFQAAIQLGDSPTTGLVIQDGTFSLHNARFSLTNADLGAVVIQNLVVQWDDPTPDNADFSLFISADVALPGNFTASGIFQMDHGQVTQIGLSISNPDGVPIPGTGLKVTDLGGLVQNINDPSHIVVTVHMAAIYGEPFQFGSTTVNLFRVEGDVTASASELILGGKVLMGAYTTDHGTTWNNVAGEGDATLTLDWAQSYYNLHMHVAGLFTVFDITGDLTFRPGVEVDFLATANVVIPSEVPFIGGDTLGGLGFFFQHIFSPASSVSTTVAGWIDIQVIWNIEVGLEYYVDASGNSSFSVIGKDQIDQFGRTVAPPVNQTYTYTVDLSNQVPAGSTKLTFSVDWSKPQPGTTVIGKPAFTVIQMVGGKTITTPESDFSGSSISLITDSLLNSSTAKALQVVGSTTNRFAPLSGNYQIQVSVTASGGNPFPNFVQQTSTTAADYPDQLKVATTHEVPRPTFGPLNAEASYKPVLQAGPRGTLSVNLSGNMDLALLTSGSPTVSVYLVRTDDVNRTRKIKIASVVPTQSSTPGVNWQAQVNIPTFGLDPFPYILYATVNDGRNAPTTSSDSLPFTPEFAFTGNLADQTGLVVSDWSVFLDYNSNGVPDANEPITTTGPLGTYGFPPTYDPSTGWSDVPVDKAVPVTIILPSNLYGVVQGNPQKMQYNGQAATSVNFTVQRPSTIAGNVFNDIAGDGIAADGTPVPGAAVYLDTNGNGILDSNEQVTYADTYGGYQFFDVPNGNYLVRVALAPLTQAVSAPLGAKGNSRENWTYGDNFQTNQPIEITTLGVFVGAGNSVVQPMTAVLYDAVTHKALATMTFTPGDPGTAVGAFYYKTLPQPIHVYAGFQGIIAAYGYGGSQLAGFASQNDNPPWSFSTNNGMISFTGSSVSMTGGQYPSQAEGSSPSFAAGTFQFRIPSPISSSSSVAVHNVSITGPYQIASGNDFGLQPPASISGVVSIASSPGATPQPTSGVTVYLSRNGIVVGSSTSGPTGYYQFSNLDPGNYSLAQQTPAGMRQVVPANTSFSFARDTTASLFTKIHDKPVALKTLNALNLPSVYALGEYSTNPFTSMYSMTVTVDGLPLFSFSGSVSSKPVGFINVPHHLIYLDDIYMLMESGEVQVLTPSGNWPYFYSGFSPSTALPTGGSIGKYRDFQIIDSPGSGSSPGAPTFWVTLFTDPTGAKSGVGIFGSNTSGPSNPTAYTWNESNPSRLLLADVNHDGIQDVIINGPSTTPTVLLVGANGQVTPRTINVLPPATAGFGLTGDINNDGLIDLGVVSADGSVTFSLQNSDGSFSTATKIQVAASGSRITYAGLLDLNRNGQPSLVLVAYDPGASTPSMRVAANIGAGPNYFLDLANQTRLSIPGDPTVNYTPITLGTFTVNTTPDPLPTIALYNGGNLSAADRGLYIHNNSPLTPQPLSLTLNSGDAETVNYVNVGTGATDPVVKLPTSVGSGNYTVAYRNGNIEVSDPAIGRLFSQAAVELHSLTIQSHAGRAGTITFDLSTAPFGLTNSILFVGAAADPNTIRVIGRAAGSTFQVDETGVSVDGVRVVHWAGLQNVQLIGGPGNDRFSVKGDPHLLSRLTIVGGGGRDVYSLAATHANIAVLDSTRHGTLDFLAASSGVVVNLGLASGQPQAIGAGGNVLSLYGAIANVAGTPFDDVILGNALDNVILGLAGSDVIFGNGGDDYLDGGLGNDRITASNGRSILLGGPGNDTLVAHSGRSLLIGGDGQDVLVSYSLTGPARAADGSLLVSGATAFDANPAALRALLMEWSSGRSLLTRIRNLLSGNGSTNRANGKVFLNAQTLKPDRYTNLIAAFPGRDLLFRNTRDRLFRP